GARRCAMAGLPRRDSVLLIGPAEPTPHTWSAAVDVGAQHICVLPAQEADLVRLLAEASETGSAGARRGRVIAVTAGAGGGGASVFSAALALCAPQSLLVDLDPYGGGIDLVLGTERAAGLRWPDLRLQSGRLSWSALREVIPQQRGVSVLSGSRMYHPIDAGAARSVVDAGMRAGVTVV
ncbi:MAG: septum site-determining protein Ssd, partial [Mycobacterium sp.]